MSEAGPALPRRWEKRKEPVLCLQSCYYDLNCLRILSGFNPKKCYVLITQDISIDLVGVDRETLIIGIRCISQETVGALNLAQDVITSLYFHATLIWCNIFAGKIWMAFGATWTCYIGPKSERYFVSLCVILNPPPWGSSRIYHSVLILLARSMWSGSNHPHRTGK